MAPLFCADKLLALGWSLCPPWLEELPFFGFSLSLGLAG